MRSTDPLRVTRDPRLNFPIISQSCVSSMLLAPNSGQVALAGRNPGPEWCAHSRAADETPKLHRGVQQLRGRRTGRNNVPCAWNLGKIARFPAHGGWGPRCRFRRLEPDEPRRAANRSLSRHGPVSATAGMESPWIASKCKTHPKLAARPAEAPASGRRCAQEPGVGRSEQRQRHRQPPQNNRLQAR